MKTAGEIIAKFFKMLVDFIGTVLKGSWCIFLGAIAFVGAVFILSIFFNAEVTAAIEIFKNFFKIP
jgi:hypothetical protein